jgi:hypothetical protein
VGARCDRLFLNQGVPLLTVGTFAEPFGALKSALLAAENGFLLGHGHSLNVGGIKVKTSGYPMLKGSRLSIAVKLTFA